jgi:UDP-glucuronate decarboxylase
MTIKELAEKILKMIGSSSAITFKPLPKDDPTRRKPDISLAERVLEWTPKIGLDEGLLMTIDDFKVRLAR